MKLIAEKIPDYLLVDNVQPTTVHYFDSSTDEIIYQRHSSIFYRLSGGSGQITLPVKYLSRLFYCNRVTTRLMRLDKGNIVWVPHCNTIVIVYDFNVYRFDLATQKIDSVKTLNFRNGLFGGLCVTPAGNIFVGEYCANWEKKPIQIWKGSNCGKVWENCFTFDSNEIFHVHSVQWDYVEEKIWVFTGDFANECKVLVTDENFESIEYMGDGGQNWRVVKPIFLDEVVVWGMDSPISPVKINILERKDRRLKSVYSLDAPVWNTKKFSEGDSVLQTTVEQLGQVGVNSNTSELLYSLNYMDWSTVGSWQKDRLPNKYFRHGLTSFPEGPQSRDKFIVNGEALINFDGVARLCAIK